MNQIPVSVKGKSVLIALLACVQLNLFGGVKSVGVSFVENYPKELYNAGTQVWSIDQDRNGIMYFGNNSGLLTFDSQGWRLYPVPNHSIVRSVMVGDDERIYVGSFNDFGYFTPDDRGELVYQSFLSRVPEENREFGEIWNIMYYKGGIIFHSYTAVFFLKDDQIKIVSYNRDLHFAFQVGNEYYVKENNRGILHLVDDKLQFVRHSDFFADYQISAIIPYGEDKLMVLTRENGIFILDNQGVMLYNTPLQAFFRNHQIFSATKTDDDFLILGTVQNGVVILDKKGNLVQHLNRNRGLQNNTVLSVFVDKTENLWLGLDNGIDFVLINSPLSYIAHESEIGTVYVMTLKKDDLYIGTNQGLYVTGWPPAPRLATSASDIEFIEGSQGQVWSLQTIHNIILVGHDKGTFIADQRKLTRLNSIQGGWTFIEVPERPGIILEGTYSGLLKYSYQPAAGGWKFVCPVEGFNESCRQIQFDNKGDLWIGHGYKGVYRLRYNERLDSIIAVRHYSEESGLPSRYESNVLKFNDEIIIGTQDGIYIYNPEQDLFEKNIELSGLFDNKNVHNLIEDQNGNLWFFGQDEAGILKSNFDGSYSKTTKPFHPVREKMIVNYEHVYPIDRSNILFSTEEGVIHFDPDFRKDYKEPFGVTIRRVEILPDSFIFGGYSLENINGYERNTIKYKNNSLRFRYSALSYEFPSRNEYSIYLEGFDTKWSDWSETTEKEYTNLHNGQYRFRVRARNIYGNESEAEPYLFAILPPWYQSTLAYILYILFFILLVIMIIRTVVRKFEKEKHAMKEKQKADIKAREKAFAEEAMKAEQEIIKLRNEKLEAENQKNLTELESKSKELASIAMQITYKNELLTQIKQKLIRVSSKMLHLESKKQVNDLIKTLEKDIITADEWERFELHFDQVHEDFIKKLRHNFNELTPKDLRLCAYLRMNLSSKEIAPLLNISVRGVEISRYRLRKKMGLSRDANLTEFMMTL